MGQIPDSPEGVALALVAIILGTGDLALASKPRDAQEVLNLYRLCLAATRPYDAAEAAADQLWQGKVGAH